MKTAAQVFYLAIFSLLGTNHAAASKSASKSQPQDPDVCSISPRAIVSDACASYATLDSLNQNIRPALLDITRQTDFFSHYRLNLFGKGCPFWDDANSMCGNIACAVNTLDNEEDIPPIWRAEELGKLKGPKAGHPSKRLQEERGLERPLQGMLGEGVGESCVVEYDDECDQRDYCVSEDESASAKGDYVSLIDNPERFTGYAGEGAKQVWDAIYSENCFSETSYQKSATVMTSQSSLHKPATNELKLVLEERMRHQAGEFQGVPFATQSSPDDCLEKRVFYRIISGMHTSISTHLCWEYLNQMSGEWGPNLQCYKERLHEFPDRVSNLYFNYALVLRAVTKLGPSLKDYTFCSGDPVQDRITKAKIQDLISQATDVPIFDESLMFVSGEGPGLKDDFRNRFRNVSRIMDCVGCDNCRLWGKIQTAGYGAALKVLFEFNDDAADALLKRTELVALVNTLARISDSLTAIHQFRTMVEADGVAKDGEDRQSVVASRPYNAIVAQTFSGGVDGDSETFENKQHPRLRSKAEAQTISEIFWSELGLVWKAYKYVLKSWVSFPQKMLDIFILEISRFWEYYVGLPISPRQWQINRPNFDEL